MKNLLQHALIRATLTLAASLSACLLYAQTAAPGPGTAPQSGTGGGTARQTGAAPQTGTAQQNGTAQQTGTAPQTRTGAGTAPQPGTNAGTAGVQRTPTQSGVNNTGNTAAGTNQNTGSARNTNGTTTNQSGVRGGGGTATGTVPTGVTSSSGTISNFGTNDFALQSGAAGNAMDFAIGDDTSFVDLAGNPVPRDRFFRRGERVPATVFYSRAPNGNLIASRVVLSENIGNTPIETAGTITEVSPGIMVIEEPGASGTPIRYVNNKTTNYVNENGEPVDPETVKAGTPVKIFYTKVGDTLVASRVQVVRKGDAGLPKPPVNAQKSTTTTRKTVKEVEK